MSRRDRAAAWPLLGVLLGLLAISLVAPRIWGHAAGGPPGAAPAIVPEAPTAASEQSPPPAWQKKEATEPAKIDIVEPWEGYQAAEPAGRIAGRPIAGDVGLPLQVMPLPPVTEEPPRLAYLPSDLSPLPRRELTPGSWPPGAEAGELAPLPEQVIPRSRTAAPTALPISRWQEPKALLEYLRELGSAGAAGKWAQEAERQIRALGPAMTSGSPQAGDVLQRLQALASQAGPTAAKIDDRTTARRLRQAGYALSRRLDVWQPLVSTPRVPLVEAESTRDNTEQLALCLREVDALMGDSPAGKAWREYLMVDALRQWPAQGRSRNRELSPRDLALAAEVLNRLTQAPMTAKQRQFVSSGPLAALESQLRDLTAEPVDPAALLEHLERYEETRLPSDARRLARDCQFLLAAADAQRRQLGRRIDAHYRNANLRLAVSAALLNRLVPEPPMQYAPVSETVLGVQVLGQSLTSTDVAIRMMPDPARARMALEFSGQVESSTASSSGPATFYNDSTVAYIARKPLELDLDGIRLEPAEVEVYNQTRLREIETDFDNIPLLGSFAYRIARSQHEQNQPAANREVRQKAIWRARQRVEAEATPRLREAARKLDERAIAPLHTLALDPTMISAETTPQRITMRLRLAGKEQVGGHTPRPQAPADSLASYQVHESAINNALEQLKLDGKTFTLQELSRHVAAKLHRVDRLESDPDHDDVTITFAESNAIGVRCQNNQAVVTLSVARLSKPPRHWYNFQVKAFYRPAIDGRSAELTREGIIHLTGQRLTVGSQITLRGIFARTFAKNRPVSLTPDQLAASPRLSDLEVTQFVVDDGWIGVAFGPKRTASRPALLTR